MNPPERVRESIVRLVNFRVLVKISKLSSGEKKKVTDVDTVRVSSCLWPSRVTSSSFRFYVSRRDNRQNVARRDRSC